MRVVALCSVVAVAAALLAWRALPACGIAGPSWLNFCPPAAATVASGSPANDRRRALESEIRRLERELVRIDMACRPTLPPGPNCPPGAVLRRPSEILILVDASLSMGFGIRAPGSLDRELTNLRLRGENSRYDALRSRLETEFGESRMAVVKQALDRALARNSLGPTRLGTFNACGRINLRARTDDMNRLRAEVQAIGLDSSTALADAIRLGAQSLDGGRSADDRVNIVLISDGLDTCGRDPCAAARQAKADKPGLAINVIDLVGLPELRCVADETGGLYQERPTEIDLDVLERTLTEASGAEGMCLP